MEASKKIEVFCLKHFWWGRLSIEFTLVFCRILTKSVYYVYVSILLLITHAAFQGVYFDILSYTHEI